MSLLVQHWNAVATRVVAYLFIANFIKRKHELRKETEKLSRAKAVGVAGLWDGVTLGQLVREPERAHVHRAPVLGHVLNT